MKIKNISVDGFGVWKGLGLDGLSSSVTVVYGRNEAGKTTLMQFLRAMLYGVAADGRHRYLPPRNGGPSGGRLTIQTQTGQYDVKRQFVLPKRSGDRRITDQVFVANEDGVAQGAQALQILLSGVDESVYRNVYAIGLREIQELGTLSDTDAARHLYDLSAGLDRVSLVDVLRELRTSRQRLYGGENGSCQISQLLQQRKELTGQLDQLREFLGRYRSLAGERARLAQQIDEIEAEHADLERQARTTETAFTLRDNWQELLDVKQRLEGMGKVPQVTRDHVAQMDKLGENISARQAESDKLKVQRNRLNQKIAALPINSAISRQGSRIEALAEQREWIASLGRQIRELDEKADATLRASGENAKRGVAETTAGKAQQALIELRDPARELKETKARMLEYQQRLEDNRDLARAEEQEINGALGSKGEQDLATAMEAAGERATSLRKRIQLDERLQRMSKQRKELEHRREDMVDENVLNPRILMWTGGAFALGVMFLLAGLMMPASTIGSFGWPLVILGLFGSAGAVLMKMAIEHASERELEACNRQRRTLIMQVEEAEKECELLDAELPRGKGPWAVQLRQAEKDLVELEELLAVDAKRQTVRHESESVEQQALHVKREYQEAKRAWHRALHDAGLPANLSPAQVRDLAESSKELDRRNEEAERFREDARQRRQELGSCVSRIEDILTDAGLEPAGRKPEDRVDQLVSVWVDQKQWLGQRRAIRSESHEVRQQQLGVAREVGKLQARRRGMFKPVGVDTVEGFHRAAKQYARFRKLTQQAKQSESELRTAIKGICSRAELDDQLEDVTAEQLERRWDGLAGKVQKAEEKLKECFERRGRLGEQLLSLGNDRRAVEVQLELNGVRQRLCDAVAKWQELAVTTQLLESIRRRYEQERQPAALQEASQFLHQLTKGRYRRIWTRLDEDALRVDDANGRHLAPEMLSSGTREQLFLALRLSLVAQYAQRGIRLPLVLDDVLVNFDTERATAAANVLRDFASLGHQIIVFTCHEHIVKIFKAENADVRYLNEIDEPVATKPRRKPRKIAAAVKQPEPPVVVEPVAEPDPPAVLVVEPADPPPVVEPIKVQSIEIDEPEYEVEDYVPDELCVPDEVYEDPQPEPEPVFEERLVVEAAEAETVEFDDGEETWEADYDEVVAERRAESGEYEPELEFPGEESGEYEDEEYEYADGEDDEYEEGEYEEGEYEEFDEDDMEDAA